MLMITIWSFHIQYGQPAAFYLKAPTLLYVFIFIVLRALTITPGYVLFAGPHRGRRLVDPARATPSTEPGGAALVTRDYVEYMNSARILIGGEIDRVISILIVTARAVGLGGARPHASFPRRHRPGRRHAVVAILLARDRRAAAARGRTAAARRRRAARRGRDVHRPARLHRLAASLPPAELIDLLREYQRIAVPIIHRNNGSVSTYLGDGIMVTFGATRPTGTYCADAMRCAEQLLGALAAWCAGPRSARMLPAPGVGVGLDCGHGHLRGHRRRRAARIRHHRRSGQPRREIAEPDQGRRRARTRKPLLLRARHRAGLRSRAPPAPARGAHGGRRSGAGGPGRPRPVRRARGLRHGSELAGRTADPRRRRGLRPGLRSFAPGLGRPAEEARRADRRAAMRRRSATPSFRQGSRRAENLPGFPFRRARGAVQRLAARTADGVPDQRLQRVHGGTDPCPLPGQVDQGHRQRPVQQPLEDEVLQAPWRRTPLSTGSSTTSCASPAATTIRACISRSIAPRSAARCCARKPTWPSAWRPSSSSRRSDSCPTAPATA